MKLFESDDYERPIETYPGYVGYTWDAEPSLGVPLESLRDIRWSHYLELLDAREDDRKIVVDYDQKSFVVDLRDFKESGDLAWVMDQIPTIEVFRDPGPPDGGPACGSGYIFFIADGVTPQDLEASVIALGKAVRVDIAQLEEELAG